MGHNHNHHHSLSTENIKVYFFSEFILDYYWVYWWNLNKYFGNNIWCNSWIRCYYKFINSINRICFIILKAILRILNSEESDAKGMMWFAILGIIVNGAVVLKLQKGASINERVVSLHMLEGVLGWVAVLIASVVNQFWNVPILDRTLSLLIALYILFNVFKNGKESIRIILQRRAMVFSVDESKAKILENKEIKNSHDCHLWTMVGEYNIITVHLLMVNKSIS
jgi:cobalt-zinc-cadmium efflux system protein